MIWLDPDDPDELFYCRFAVAKRLQQSFGDNWNVPVSLVEVR